jgi:hypothetical protein
MKVDLCQTKKDHLYKRFYCKLCLDFHSKDSEEGELHKEYKLNRYFCPLCRRTHISSRGNIFLEHLKERGKEISYYGECCALKCSVKKIYDKTLTDEQAKIIMDLQHKIWDLDCKIYDKENKFTLKEDKDKFEHIRRMKKALADKEYKLGEYKMNIGI